MARFTHRIRFPIALKLTLLLVIAAVLPLAVAAYALTQRGLAGVETAAQRNLQLVAVVTATRLDQIVIETSRLVAIKCSDPEIVSLCSAAPGDTPAAPAAAARRALDAVIAANPDVASAFVTDRRGVGLAATNSSNVGMDFKFRDYMQKALAGEAFVSDLLIGRTTREPGLYFSGPVKDGSGGVVGAVVIKLHGGTLTRVCDDVSGQLPGGFAGIVDRYGILLSSPNPEAQFKSLAPLTPEDVRDLNPQLRFGFERIDTLGLDTLGRAVRSATGPGNVAFVDRSRQRQVAGFAPVAQRPWTVVAVQQRAEFDRPLRQLAWQAGIVAAGLAIVAAAAAILLARRLVRPIHALTQAASRVAEGDLTVRADVNTHDEIRQLAHVFNTMVPKLHEHTQMEHALRLAQDIQQHLLPDNAPPMAGLDVAGSNTPADQTGGDYYDFLDLSSWRDGTLAVAVGDVTGHGVPAALLMATARALLRSRATPPGDLSELFADVNRRLHADVPVGRFMTLMYALVDRGARRVRLVSAGHDPILVYSPSTGTFRELEGSDVPLAVERDWVFTEHVYEDLPADAVLVIGTDGIWEAHNAAREMFGKERFREIVRTHATRSAAEIMTAVKTAVRSFRGAGPQEDDVTLVVLRFI